MPCNSHCYIGPFARGSLAHAKGGMSFHCFLSMLDAGHAPVMQRLHGPLSRPFTGSRFLKELAPPSQSSEVRRWRDWEICRRGGYLYCSPLPNVLQREPTSLQGRCWRPLPEPENCTGYVPRHCAALGWTPIERSSQGSSPTPTAARSMLFQRFHERVLLSFFTVWTRRDFYAAQVAWPLGALLSPG